jgi:putative nucleotidyltransferase with HDIG domain
VAVALQTDGDDPDAPWRVTTTPDGQRHEYDVSVPALELDELKEHRDSMVINRGGGSRSYLHDWTSGNGDPVVVLPLHRKNDVIGLIAMEYRTTEQVDAELREARQLANQVSVALSNAHLVMELDALSTGALTALARTIDANSQWTAGHSERVTNLALVLGSELGLPQNDLDTLYRGGLLHDIGKIGVPAAILDNPGKLTVEEFEIVKQHPSTGARILSPIKAYADTIPLVLHHHERFDGKGYPHGLAGEEIPFLARLVCVVDVYDALTSDRPYRQGWTVSKAGQHIVTGAGTQFDPALANAFGRALENGRVENPGTLEANSVLIESGNWNPETDWHDAGLAITER